MAMTSKKENQIWNKSEGAGQTVATVCVRDLDTLDST